MAERIELTPAEVAFATNVATQRNARKKRPDSRLSRTHSGFGVHFAGVIGEIAFTKVHGGKISQSCLAGGDSHLADVIDRQGRHVEVKTSLFPGSNVEMKFEGTEIESMEWACLVQLFLPDVANVFPVIAKQLFLDRCTVKDYGNGQRLILCGQEME
jgi:hypothetical protein